MNSLPANPRWLLLRDVPQTAALLRGVFGGPQWRHVIKVCTVPHLVVTGHRVALGISPDRGTRNPLARARRGVLQASWLLAASLSRRVRRTDPWCLRSGRNVRWRLVNLARSAADRRSAAITLPLCLHALALADEAGMEVQANVDRCQPRLVRAYERAGFVVTSSDLGEYILRRPARRPLARRRAEHSAWRHVVRTGRVGAEGWHARFGPVPAPVLDVGSGDSPLVHELVSAGTAAVALDPQFSLRPPAWRSPASVAGVAEALPFRSNVFGTVHASYVIQHSAQPAKVLAELVRVARADGVVLVHPLWRPAEHRVLGEITGVSILPGRFMPPRRQRPSIRISVAELDLARDGSVLAGALRPGYLARAAGRIAMRIVISARRTSSVGPGAVR